MSWGDKYPLHVLNNLCISSVDSEANGRGLRCLSEHQVLGETPSCKPLQTQAIPKFSCIQDSTSPAERQEFQDENDLRGGLLLGRLGHGVCFGGG